MKRAWLFLLVWCVAVAPVFAHIVGMPDGTATIQPDGRYKLELTFDVLAFALDEFPENVTDVPMNELIDGPEDVLIARLGEAQKRFENEYSVSSNGQLGTVDMLIFPSSDDIRRYKESGPLIRLPCMLALTVEGRLPPGARAVSFRLPAKFGMVSLSVVRPEQSVGVLMVDPGNATTAMPVRLDPVTDVPETQNNTVDYPAIEEPSRWEWAQRYVELGFIHIVPRGLDHILFVLGLFLLSKKLRPLLMQITAFTVAHSITLAMSMYGVFSIPSAVVEPLIALSIAFVAIENMITSDLHRWRLLVVFAFGLIHGLGFASVLTSLGLPRGALATALLSFNVGVELGQLTVIALALIALGWWRKYTWYRRFVALPASGLIASVGVIWTIERIILYTR